MVHWEVLKYKLTPTLASSSFGKSLGFSIALAIFVSIIGGIIVDDEVLNLSSTKYKF